MSEATAVRCGACNYLIAFTDREEIQIKIKDLYVYVKGGLVTMTCRGCGRLNYCCDEAYKKEFPDEIIKVQKLINIIEARFSKFERRPLQQVKEEKHV